MGVGPWSLLGVLGVGPTYEDFSYYTDFGVGPMAWLNSTNEWYKCIGRQFYVVLTGGMPLLLYIY